MDDTLNQPVKHSAVRDGRARQQWNNKKVENEGRFRDTTIVKVQSW